MAFVDQITGYWVEADVGGAPAGRYYMDVHRTMAEDPTYVRSLRLEMDAAAFSAVFDNASVGLSQQVQTLSAQIAALHELLAQRTQERDALRREMAGQ